MIAQCIYSQRHELANSITIYSAILNSLNFKILKFIRPFMPDFDSENVVNKFCMATCISSTIKGETANPRNFSEEIYNIQKTSCKHPPGTCKA